MQELSITKILYYIIIGWLIVSPFSIALHHIGSGLVASVLVFYLILNNNKLRSILRHPLICWLSIPGFYLFSLSYSQDHHRGWKEWLDMAPMILIILSIPVLKLDLETRQKCMKYALLSIVLSTVVHLFLVQGWWTFTKLKTAAPMSTFYAIDTNVWIWWSGVVVSGIWCRHYLGCYVSLVLCSLAMIHAGQPYLLLITLVVLPFLFKEKLAATYLRYYLVAVCMAYLAGAFFFTSSFEFEHSSFLQNILFSMYQCSKHPLTGVGIGDVIHAMWNEYQVHGLEQITQPPVFQWMHLLVSCGILAWGVFFVILKSIKHLIGTNQRINYLLLVMMLVSLPFTHSMSVLAFFVPLLLHDGADKDLKS